jgi:hypothetical protein
MSREAVETALTSGDPDRIGVALVSTVNFEDIDTAVDVVQRCALSSNPHVRGTAILSIGHIARIHKSALVVAKLIPLLNKGLTDSSNLVRGMSQDAVDDIEVFLPSLLKLVRKTK